jgi:DNA-binding MarR family transcriptional regulator
LANNADLCAREFALNKDDALKLTELTADLMMVIGRMKRSARQSESDVIHPGTEFAIIDTILRHGCKTVPEIAAWRGVARQSVQSVVNKLIEAGLIGQRPNPDHKVSSILVVEAEGLRHYEQARELMCARYQSGETQFKPGELEIAARVISVIAKTWGAGAD